MVAATTVNARRTEGATQRQPGATPWDLNVAQCVRALKGRHHDGNDRTSRSLVMSPFQGLHVFRATLPPRRCPGLRLGRPLGASSLAEMSVPGLPSWATICRRPDVHRDSREAYERASRHPYVHTSTKKKPIAGRGGLVSNDSKSDESARKSLWRKELGFFLGCAVCAAVQTVKNTRTETRSAVSLDTMWG